MTLRYNSSTFFLAQGVLLKNFKLDLMLGSSVKHLTAIRFPNSSQPYCSTRRVRIISSVMSCKGLLGCSLVMVLSIHQPSGLARKRRTTTANCSCWGFLVRSFSRTCISTHSQSWRIDQLDRFAIFLMRMIFDMLITQEPCVCFISFNKTFHT